MITDGVVLAHAAQSLVSKRSLEHVEAMLYCYKRSEIRAVGQSVGRDRDIHGGSVSLTVDPRT